MKQSVNTNGKAAKSASLLLSASLAVGMMPAIALADDNSVETPENVTGGGTLLETETVASAIDLLAEEDESGETADRSVFTSPEAFFNAKNIDLGGDVEIQFSGSFEVTSDCNIDLNGNTLILDHRMSLVIKNGAVLKISNGYIVVEDGTDVTKSSISPESSSSVILDDVQFTTCGTALYPKGDAANVTVNDSTIIADGYAVGTNAEESDNYNVEIILNNSTFNASSSILLNVPGKLNMTDCVVNGSMHGVIVRGGTAVITQSTINQCNKIQYYEDYFNNKNWEFGNGVTLAALTIGNKGEKAYNYPTEVTLNDVNISATGLSPAIYAYSSSENIVTLKMDDRTVIKGDVDYGNNVASINGRMYTSIKEALTSVEDGETVSLIQDVVVSDYMDDTQSASGIPSTGILISRKNNVTLDGNGHSVAFGDEASARHLLQVWNSQNITLKNIELEGDNAVYDALLVNQDSSVNLDSVRIGSGDFGSINVDKNSALQADEASEIVGAVWVDDDNSKVTLPDSWGSIVYRTQTYYLNELAVKLDQTELALEGSGDQKTLQGTASYSSKLPEGFDELLSQSIVWASSDDSVVEVADGVVTAVGDGSATVTATLGSVSASCAVTVGEVQEAPVPTPPTGGDVTDPDPDEGEEIVDDDNPLAGPVMTPDTFTDINGDEDFYDSVKKLYDLGIMTGYGQNTGLFAPGLTMDRAQFITILYRINGEPEVEVTAQPFPDVPMSDDTYFLKAVAWAKENGVTTGYEDTGLFRPFEKVSREMMATFLNRYSALMGYPVQPTGNAGDFSDGAMVSDWAKEGVDWAIGAGIIQGYSGTTLIGPADGTIRAHGAIMIARFLDNVVPADSDDSADDSEGSEDAE